MASGRAAYILSHLTKMLLPEEVKIIGVSSYNTMVGLPVDAVIDRRAETASEKLRETINSFTGPT